MFIVCLLNFKNPYVLDILTNTFTVNMIGRLGVAFIINTPEKRKRSCWWSGTDETRIVETESQIVYFTIISIFMYVKIAIIEY